MIYFIRGRDFKVTKWKEEAPEEMDIRLIAGSRIVFGLKVMKESFFLNSSEVTVVQRYLNDYPSLLLSLLLTLTDLFFVLYLKARNIKLYWICHNIDKESHSNFPRLLAFRRWLVTQYASKILVLDPLFVKYARLLFQNYKGEIASVSFGLYDSSIEMHKTEELKSIKNPSGPTFYEQVTWSDLIEVLDQFRENEYVVGYCAGSVLGKKKYLHNIPKLIAVAKEQNIKLKLLVISDLKASENQELHDFMVELEDVLFINKLMSLDLFEIANHIDFYWTGYDDLSMPYSVYSAASTNVPIVSMNIGIIPMVLKEYNIGVVLSYDFSNLNTCISQIRNNSFSFRQFLETHTWKSLGEALK